MKCEHEKKFLTSTKQEPAFISRGFTYWKECTSAFKKHALTKCHSEAVQALIVLPQCTQDIGELQSSEHATEKARNRKMFMLVLRSIWYLARQGLALRGDCDESDAISFNCFIPRSLLVLM